MRNTISNIGLALCIVLVASVFGCNRTPEQQGKIDEMKETVSDSAGKMKESAGDSVDTMKESAGQMKDSADQYVDDSTITAKVKEKLVADPATSAYDISVETLNGTVQLSGFVQSSAEKAKAEGVAKTVPGVKSVKNDLILKSKTQGMNDSKKIRFA